MSNIKSLLYTLYWILYCVQFIYTFPMGFLMFNQQNRANNLLVYFADVYGIINVIIIKYIIGIYYTTTIIPYYINIIQLYISVIITTWSLCKLMEDVYVFNYINNNEKGNNDHNINLKIKAYNLFAFKLLLILNIKIKEKVKEHLVKKSQTLGWVQPLISLLFGIILSSIYIILTNLQPLNAIIITIVISTSAKILMNNICYLFFTYYYKCNTVAN